MEEDRRQMMMMNEKYIARGNADTAKQAQNSQFNFATANRVI